MFTLYFTVCYDVASKGANRASRVMYALEIQFYLYSTKSQQQSLHSAEMTGAGGGAGRVQYAVIFIGSEQDGWQYK